MELQELTRQLRSLDYKGLYQNDFFLAWERSMDELNAIYLEALAAAEQLRLDA